MASEDPKMSEQCTAGKRKQATLDDSSKTSNKLACHVNNVEKWKDQLQSFMISSESVKYLFQWHTLKEPKLLQMDKVLCKQFTAPGSKGNVTVPKIIANATSFITQW